MGCTYAYTKVKNFVGYNPGRSASFTMQGSDAIALTLPLFAVLPQREKKEAVHHAEASGPRQGFVIRGGFYKMADSKRRLFFAGSIRKPARVLQSQPQGV